MKQNIGVIQTADATDSVPGESLVRSLDYFHLFYLFLPSVELLITILLLPSLPHVRVQAAICSADLSEQEVAAARLRHMQTTQPASHIFPPSGKPLRPGFGPEGRRPERRRCVEDATGAGPAAAALRGTRKRERRRRGKRKRKKNPFSLGISLNVSGEREHYINL